MIAAISTLDHAAHDVLRAKPRNVLHHVGHVDHAVARNHANFEIVEEREFHLCSWDC
jgi:hypothetical protein